MKYFCIGCGRKSATKKDAPCQDCLTRARMKAPDYKTANHGPEEVIPQRRFGVRP